MAWTRRELGAVIAVLVFTGSGALPPGSLAPAPRAADTPSTATPLTVNLAEASTPTPAVASSATPSTATPSTATPSTATPSTATPSTATPAVASTATSKPTSAGATLTEDVLTGRRTVWGHEESGGVERLSDSSIPRFDLLEAVRDHAPSEQCRRALDDVLAARTQLRLWALKMTAASVVLPDALLYGNMYSLGDFDGCLSVPDAMYALLDVEVRPARPAGAPPAQPHLGDDASPYEPPHGHNATLWGLLQTSGHRRRYRRDLQQWALCLPAACGLQGGGGTQGPGQAAEAAAQAGRLGRAVAEAVAGVARTLGVELRLSLRPGDCQSAAAVHVPSEDNDFFMAVQARPRMLIGTVFVLAFPALMVIATARAAFRKLGEDADPDARDNPEPEKRGALGQGLECFAIQNTWAKLCRFQNSQIHSIQGIRTITMVGIVFGHRTLYLFAGPLLNPEYVENSFTRVLKMLVINGNVVVATFFVISGFLEGRLSMMHIGKLRRFHPSVVLQHYVIRYLRLLPALTVMLAIETLWIQYMGSGPTWDQMVGRTSRDCREHWWKHLLFVNNYVAQESACMLQTWFAAAVLQMYLFTPLLMWLVSRWTLRALWPGCTLLGLLLTAACALHYYNTVQLDLHPTVHTYPQVLFRRNFLSDPTFVLQYIKTHTNAVPYIVGLIVGTLFYLANKREWRPSKTVGTVMWLGIPLSAVLMLATIFSGVIFFMPDFESRPLLDAAYGPARLLVFSLGPAWVIFTCGLGQGGKFDALLAWSPLVSLGRLTYSVYLVHVAVITVTAGSVREPVYLSNYNVGTQVAADVMVSYVLGLLLHFCVEAPMANIQALVTAYWFHKSGSALLTKDRGPQEEPAQPPEAPDDSEDVHEDASRRSSTSTTRRSSTCTTNL